MFLYLIATRDQSLAGLLFATAPADVGLRVRRRLPESRPASGTKPCVLVRQRSLSRDRAREGQRPSAGGLPDATPLGAIRSGRTPDRGCSRVPAPSSAALPG